MGRAPPRHLSDLAGFDRAARRPQGLSPQTRNSSGRSARHRSRHPSTAHASALTVANDADTAGDLTHGDALYPQPLAAGPNSVDALNGLGVIAVLHNRPTEPRQDASIAAGAA